MGTKNTWYDVSKKILLRIMNLLLLTLKRQCTKNTINFYIFSHVFKHTVSKGGFTVDVGRKCEIYADGSIIIS